jgi:hypothetical protein
MRNYLQGLAPPSNGPPARSLEARISLEGLEDRLTPSGSGLASTDPPAVSVAFSPTGAEMIAVVRSDHTFTEYAGNVAVMQLNNVNSASVAFSPTGLELLNVVTQANTLIQYSNTGQPPQTLLEGVRSISIAFSPTGLELLNVVFTNGVLTQFNNVGVPPQNLLYNVSSTSICFSPTGLELLNVLTTDGVLTQYNNVGAPAQVLTPGAMVNSASEAISPTTGDAFLNVVYQNGSSFQFGAMGDAHPLPTGATASAIAFNSNGLEVLDLLFQDGSLMQFDSMGGGFTVTATS